MNETSYNKIHMSFYDISCILAQDGLFKYVEKGVTYFIQALFWPLDLKLRKECFIRENICKGL